MLLSQNLFSTIKSHNFLKINCIKPPTGTAKGTVEPFKQAVKGIVKLVLSDLI